MSARSFSSSGAGSSVRSFSGSGSGTRSIGSQGTHNNATFMKNNFSGNTAHTGSIQHNVNRINTGGLNNANSFVHKNNITNNSPQHWTHSGNNQNHLHANNNNWKNGNQNWNNWNRHNNNFWPWWGWGGIGLWGLGWGWGWPYYGWGYPLYGYNYYGYGNGYGYGNNYVVAAAPLDPQADQATAGDFTDQGEIDFKAGKYEAAARAWQHALVDDPKNGAVILLLGQALFAIGRYDEAAGATQAAMQSLPEDKWNVVIANYTQLYGNPLDYNTQVKALETARNAKPDSPAIRFLLGFHFGYLGYPKQAVTELDKGLNLAPRDLGALKLRGIFAAKWPEAPALPAAAAEAAKELEKGGPANPPGDQSTPAPPAANPPGEQPGTPS
jgi:tetratricopeptide (TPR) repeat protein